MPFTFLTLFDTCHFLASELLASCTHESVIDTNFITIEVADRFGLDRLKHMCEDVIRQALDVESAERLLLLADRYSGKN